VNQHFVIALGVAIVLPTFADQLIQYPHPVWKSLVDISLSMLGLGIYLGGLLKGGGR
tara:strand:- start:10550 stop:10720 length:171 start_codon:yes stop_codon:yes gene_type:complete